MNNCITTTLAVFLVGSCASSQEHFRAPTPVPEVRAYRMELSEGGVNVFSLDDAGTSMGDQDDPAYKTYKEGYKLILEEKWKEARKKFAEVVSNYKESDYRDDAAYWSAFALKHIDRKKAEEAYLKFMTEHPQSKYYDDAVADYEELTEATPKVLGDITVKDPGRVYVVGDGFFVDDGKHAIQFKEDGGIVIGEGDDSLVVGKKNITIKSNGKSYSYAYGFAPKARALEHALRIYRKNLSRLRTPRALPSLAPMIAGEEKLDPDEQLRLEALYALGVSRDETSFQTLKTIALDLKQPKRLRETSIDMLSDFQKFDVLPIFTEIAQKDTSEFMQMYAVDYIREHGKDKNKTVITLIDLFNALPSKRDEQRRNIFYYIADIGNDRAVDFLASVAKTNPDYDLRREAVYYLGSIGGEKARAALHEILRGQK